MRAFRLIPALAATMILLTSTGSAIAAKGDNLRAEVAKPGPAPAASEPISGKVVESMDSGGYTYVLLKEDGRKTWVAVPSMKVKTGEDMVFQPGNRMMNFNSKTLNRTFDSIIFSPGPLTLPGTKADKVKTKAAVPAQKVAKVEMAAGKNAQTVEACYKNTDSLNGKQVTVRGKVVKVSLMIMGVNWVHIQDGTGDASKGTHNLVVTTEDKPEKDDVVTATGTLAKDKDFGYGYKYDVIVEKAKITK